MKPQFDHPMVAHKTKKEQSAPELPVHTVMSPEDEAFAKQMQQNETTYSQYIKQPAPAAVDAILDREMKKRDVFTKLVLLKEDHYTEAVLGDLTFRLKLLNSIDNVFIMKEARKEPAEDQLNTLSLLVLSAAIYDVDGVKLEELYSGPSSVEHPILRKYYELRQWQRPVVNALHKIYGDFQASVEQGYTKDFLKK